MRRYRVRVAAEQLEAALAAVLEAFPGGVEQEDEGESVVLTGYAEEAPALAGVEEAGAPEPGWETRWRDFHRPAREGVIDVRAPWHPAVPDAVVIDPGAAFGTGAHGSTRAALALLQALPPSPALDLGCGSGVLAIAACRLGFGPVLAVDVEPAAVAATRENARRNGVFVEARLANVLVDPLPEAPLWIANLELGLLERLLGRPDVPETLLASGLLAAQTLGGERRCVRDGWAAELVHPRAGGGR
jgi:ribosomal protein L11 methyltransferase